MVRATVEKVGHRKDGVVDVWVHAQPAKGGPAESEGIRKFSRVPSVGEHLMLTLGGSLYEVTRVIHLPFELADSIAEIFAIELGVYESI